MRCTVNCAVLHMRQTAIPPSAVLHMRVSCSIPHKPREGRGAPLSMLGPSPPLHHATLGSRRPSVRALLAHTWPMMALPVCRSSPQTLETYAGKGASGAHQILRDAYPLELVAHDADTRTSNPNRQRKHVSSICLTSTACGYWSADQRFYPFPAQRPSWFCRRRWACARRRSRSVTAAAR